MSHLKAWLEKGPLPSSRGCWQDTVPCKLLNWGPRFVADCWLLESGLSHSPLPSDIPSLTVFSIKGAGREGSSELLLARWMLQSYMIMEGMSHHFCCGLWVRSYSEIPLMPNERNVPQRNDYQNAGPLEPSGRSERRSHLPKAMWQVHW